MVTVIELSNKLDILTENICKYFENIQKKHDALEKSIVSLDNRLNNLHSTVNILLSNNKCNITSIKNNENELDTVDKDNVIIVDTKTENKKIDNNNITKNKLYTRRYAI